MNKEKQQIEEMAKVIASVPPIKFPIGSRMQGRHIYTATKIAEHLYSADYRKQSEGEWIDQYQGQYVNQLYKCSVCGETAFHDDKRWFLTNFCPNCGAKMKGGAE